MPSHPPVAPSAVSPTAAGASCSRANEREHHQSALHQRLGLVREGGEHGIVQIALPGHLNTHIVRSHWREPITTDLEIGGTITDELALTCCERTSKARYDKIRYVEDIGRRGAFVGFGNTSPCTRADVYFGLAQRGVNTRALLPPGVVATFRPALYTHRRRLRRVQEAGLRPRAVALGHGLVDALLSVCSSISRTAAGASSERSRWCGSSDATDAGSTVYTVGCRTRWPCGTS